MLYTIKNSTLFRTTACLLTVCSGTALLTGCAREISPDVYSESHVGESSRTFRGVVASVREIRVTNAEKLQENQTGIAAGAIIGGVGGNQLGKGRGKVAATAAGALLGAVAGAYAEQALSSQDAFEYIVELQNGEMRTVVQGKDKKYLPGQRVLVIVGQSGRSRIVPDTATSANQVHHYHHHQSAPYVPANHYNPAPQYPQAPAYNPAPHYPQGPQYPQSPQYEVGAPYKLEPQYGPNPYYPQDPHYNTHTPYNPQVPFGS